MVHIGFNNKETAGNCGNVSYLWTLTLLHLLMQVGVSSVYDINTFFSKDSFFIV